MEAMEFGPRSERTHAAIDRLVRTMRLHHRVVEKRIDGLGVHHSQHRTLMKLSRMGRTASQKDIARALDVSPACVARTLKALSAAGLIDKALEASGWIEKSEGEDGRCREIALNAAGQRLVDDSIKTFRRIDADMFEGITDGEILSLTRTLEKLYQNLCKMENGEGGTRP